MDPICLDARLSAVARWVLPGRVAADIGTDHAYLPVYLVSGAHCPAVIASDVAPGPYERALATVRQRGLEQQISVRLGPGLSVLEPGEAATLVLAGMGGRLICQLLEEQLPVAAAAERLVLQPQKNPEAVRRWLMQHHWRIVADDLATDGRLWYQIIAAEAGEMKLSDEQVDYGLLTPNVDRQLRRQWLCFRRSSLLTISSRLDSASGPAAAERKTQLELETLRLEKLIGEVDHA